MRIIGILLLALLAIPSLGRADNFISLCFHDIRADAGGGDDLSMSTDRFVALLTWLRQHGYRPVSIDDLLRTQRGEATLPEKAVLLTFDDGYRDFYNQVYPLLKAYRYPAVLAVVGSWLDAAPGETVDYGGKRVSREKFLSWEQLQEMSESGLVEIASHSYNGHRGVQANPQGNQQPALAARAYTVDTGRYEDDGEYIRRISLDLQQNARLLERRLGKRPRVMVWPFGKHSQPAIAAARGAGMPITLGLSDGFGNTGQLSRVPRFLIQGATPLPDLTWRIRHLLARDPRRVAQVDLDYVYDPDPLQTERNLDLLLDRIKALKINTVYLQAFADPDGNGEADALYFPNAYLPMRADLFNRVAWQLKTRAGVEVYAWLPVLSFTPPKHGLLVRNWRPEERRAVVDPQAYQRLSPFVPGVRRWIREIYRDLARHADFDGLLFHDDALLAEGEDAHPAAMVWRRSRGLSDDPATLWNDEEAIRSWARLKTEFLIDFTSELADAVRQWRPEIRTARNLYARPALDAGAEVWFSQSLDLFLRHYDFTALMAMPYLEGVQDIDTWLQRLVAAVDRHPEGLNKTVFELQSVNWNEPRKPLASGELAWHMKMLQRLGAINFGYYPDDFLTGHPAAEQLHPAISLNTDPFGN